MPKVRIADIELFYETKGEGEPLLLIHGLGGSGHDWDRQIAAFRASYRVIAMDLRGHGRSDKPYGPYTIAQFAADAANLLDLLGVESAHVVGWSLGGMVAFQLTVNRPDLVKRLVVVNATPEFYLHTLAGRLWLHERQMLVRMFGMRHFAEVLAKQLFPKPTQKLQRRQLIERFSKNDRHAYLAALGAGTRGWSVTEHLENIHCPTLMITGSKDYTSSEHKAEYVAKMPNAELVVIPDSGHATPADQPGAFNKALRTFLAGGRAQSATAIGSSDTPASGKRDATLALPVRRRLVYAAYVGLSYIGIRDLYAEHATLAPALYLALLTAALVGIIALMRERPRDARAEER